jgi:hypothetical protein
MPAYPAVLGLLARVGMSPLSAGVLISAGFEIGALMLAWRLAGERSFLALLACALVPGQVYHHAIFPISMCVFFLLLALSLLLRARWIEAGASGAIAALTYSTGFLVAPIAAAYAAAVSGTAAARLRRALVAGGIAALGLVAVFALHQATVGAWDAFLRVQAKYQHGLHSPVATWIDAVSPLWTGHAALAPAVQAVVVAAGLAALVVWRIALGFRARDALLLGTALVYWFFPLVAGGVSLYRADSLLVPALVVLGEAPAAVNAAVCAGLAALAFFMARLFFVGVLV